MNIMAIGDIVGSIGCNFLSKKLPSLKRIYNIDLVIANGENSADGNGITPVSANNLFSCGVDVITTGNHAFRRKEMFEMYETNEFVIRPANYPIGTTPGRGMCTVDMGKYQVNVINLMGCIYLDNIDCPFKTVDSLLEKSNSNITIVDFHAEATSEKRALGFYLDGRVSAVFGTHTHVQTSDDCILPNGTGYITDVGMTGVIDSVLGVKKELVISKLKNKLPVRFDLEKGECKINCIIFTIDEKNGRTISVQRLEII